MIGFVGKERKHAAYYIVINVQSHQVYIVAPETVSDVPRRIRSDQNSSRRKV